MPEKHRVAKLIPAVEDFQRQIDEAPDRGYLSHLLVEVDGARLYPVVFYNVGVLQLDLAENARHGQPFVAEIGMIVLQDTNWQAMQQAVQRLCETGYFDYMVPVTWEQVAKADPFAWPP